MIKNQINTYADLTAYNDDQSKEYPNISYIVATDEVKWQGQDTKLIATFNVNTTSSATKLFNYNNNISKMWIDGVEQQSLVKNYTFDTTGEHEVKYQLIDETKTTNSMFEDCLRMSKIIIPNNVTRIGDKTFWQCNGLGRVDIPSSVTSIGQYAFYYCHNMLAYIHATIPPTLGNKNAFTQNGNPPIYVPTESVEAYKTAPVWSDLASRIQAIPTT